MKILKMMISERNQKEDLELWLKFIEPYLDDLNVNEKKNAQLWLNKLFEPTTNVNIALDYLKLLVDSVQQHRIDEVFIKPPQEGQLPNISSESKDLWNEKRSDDKLNRSHSNVAVKNDYESLKTDKEFSSAKPTWKNKSQSKYDSNDLLECINYLINPKVLENVLSKKSKVITEIDPCSSSSEENNFDSGKKFFDMGMLQAKINSASKLEEDLNENEEVKRKTKNDIKHIGKLLAELESNSERYRLVLKCKQSRTQENKADHKTDRKIKSDRTTQEGNGDISEIIANYSDETVNKIEGVFDNVEIEMNEENIYKIARDINKEKNYVINGLPNYSMEIKSNASRTGTISRASRRNLKTVESKNHKRKKSNVLIVKNASSRNLYGKFRKSNRKYTDGEFDGKSDGKYVDRKTGRIDEESFGEKITDDKFNGEKTNCEESIDKQIYKSNNRKSDKNQDYDSQNFSLQIKKKEVNERVERIVREIRKELKIDGKLDEKFDEVGRSRNRFYSKLFARGYSKNDIKNQKSISNFSDRSSSKLNTRSKRTVKKHIGRLESTECMRLNSKSCDSSILRLFEKLNKKQFARLEMKQNLNETERGTSMENENSNIRNSSTQYERTNYEQYERANSKQRIDSREHVKAKDHDRINSKLYEKETPETNETQNRANQTPSTKQNEDPNTEQNESTKQIEGQNKNKCDDPESDPKDSQKSKLDRKLKINSKENKNLEAYNEFDERNLNEYETNSKQDKSSSKEKKKRNKKSNRKEKPKGETNLEYEKPHVERSNSDRSVRPNLERRITPNLKRFEKLDRQQYEKENFELYGMHSSNYEQNLEEYEDLNEYNSQSWEDSSQEFGNLKKKRGPRRNQKQKSNIDRPFLESNIINGLDEYVLLNIDEYKRLSSELYDTANLEKFKYDQRSKCDMNKPKCDERSESKYDEAPKSKYDERAESERPESKYDDRSKSRAKFKYHERTKSKCDQTTKSNHNERLESTHDSRSKSEHIEPLQTREKNPDLKQNVRTNLEYHEKEYKRRSPEGYRNQHLEEYERQNSEEDGENLIEYERQKLDEYDSGNLDEYEKIYFMEYDKQNAKNIDEYERLKSEESKSSNMERSDRGRSREFDRPYVNVFGVPVSKEFEIIYTDVFGDPISDDLHKYCPVVFNDRTNSKDRGISKAYENPEAYGRMSARRIPEEFVRETNVDYGQIVPEDYAILTTDDFERPNSKDGERSCTKISDNSNSEYDEENLERSVSKDYERKKFKSKTQAECQDSGEPGKTNVERNKNPNLDYYENMNSDERFEVILDNLKSSLQNPKSRHESLKLKHQKSNVRCVDLNPKGQGLKSRRDSPKSRRNSPRSRRDSPRSKREWSKVRRDSPKSRRDSPKSRRESRRSKHDNPRSKQQNPKPRRDSPNSQFEIASPILEYEKIYENSMSKHNDIPKSKRQPKFKPRYDERSKSKYYRSKSKIFERFHPKERSNRIRYQRLISNQYDELNNNRSNYIERVNSTIFEESNENLYDNPIKHQNRFRTNYKSFSECNVSSKPPQNYMKIEIRESRHNLPQFNRHNRCRSLSPQKRRYVHTNTPVINDVGREVTRSEIFHRPRFIEKDINKIYMMNNTPIYVNLEYRQSDLDMKREYESRDNVYDYPSYSYQNFYAPYRGSNYDYIISDDGLSMENDIYNYDMGLRRVQDWNTYIPNPIYYSESIVLDDPYWIDRLAEDKIQVHSPNEAIYVAKNVSLTAGYNDLCDKNYKQIACKKVNKGVYVADCDGPFGSRKKVPIVIQKRIIPVDSQYFTEIINCHRAEPETSGRIERVKFVPTVPKCEMAKTRLCCPEQNRLCVDYVCGCSKFYENLGMTNLDKCMDRSEKKTLPCGGRVICDDMYEQRINKLNRDRKNKKKCKEKNKKKAPKPEKDKDKDKDKNKEKEKKKKKEKKKEKKKGKEKPKKKEVFESKPPVALNEVEDDGNKRPCLPEPQTKKCDVGVCTCGKPKPKVSVGVSCNPKKCLCGPNKPPNDIIVDTLKTRCCCGLKGGTENISYDLMCHDSKNSFKKELLSKEQIKKIFKKQLRCFSKICKHYKNIGCATNIENDDNFVSVGVQPSIIISPTKNDFYDEILLEKLINNNEQLGENKERSINDDILLRNEETHLKNYLKLADKNHKTTKNVCFKRTPSDYYRSKREMIKTKKRYTSPMTFNLVSSLTKFTPRYKNSSKSTSKTSYLRYTDLELSTTDAQSIDYSDYQGFQLQSCLSSQSRSFFQTPTPTSSSHSGYSRVLEKKLNRSYDNSESDGKSNDKYSSIDSISVPARKIKRNFQRKLGRKVNVKQFLYLLESLKKVIND